MDPAAVRLRAVTQGRPSLISGCERETQESGHNRCSRSSAEQWRDSPSETLAALESAVREDIQVCPLWQSASRSFHSFMS